MNKEHQIEVNLIEQLAGFKYIYRLETVDKKSLEFNFLLAPLELSWKERWVKELALKEDLVPQ